MDAILKSPTGRSRPPAVDRDAAELILRRFAGSRGILLLTVPAPEAEPAALLAAGGDDAFAYLPPAGPSFAGLGTVATLAARGEDRFAAVAAQTARISAACEPIGAGCAPLGPHFFGGLAFAPGAADAYPWAGFGDASFVLPRWLYRRSGESGATLSLALRGEELSEPGERRLWLARLAALASSLGRPLSPAAAGAVRPLAAPAAETLRRLRKIGALLAAGRARKLVTALRLVAELERPDPLGAFRRLAAAAAGSDATPFFFRRGGAVFLGASPELLVSRSGLEVRSEAVAGSWRGGRPLAELFASAKIAEEHRLVADAIAAALGGCCPDLVASGRELRRLGELAHLATRFAGRLAAPRHLFELASLLHPTPAVGGSPPAAAAALLAEIGEPPRGWYAGPVGYCDGEGGGELRVALRSALLRGRRAWLHAGAGIVAASSPEDELAEMLAKTRPMLAALGAKGSAAAVHEPFIAAPQAPPAGRAETPHLCPIA